MKTYQSQEINIIIVIQIFISLVVLNYIKFYLSEMGACQDCQGRYHEVHKVDEKSKNKQTEKQVKSQSKQYQVNQISFDTVQQQISQKSENQSNSNQNQNKESFLIKVFEDLKSKKNIGGYSNLPINTVYKGFKTIPIQKLDPRDIVTQQRLPNKNIWHKDLVKRVVYYQQNHKLTMEHNNGFFHAFHQAYINHGDIKITPDEVWMIISLYFSKYVDTNAESLRRAFVNHEGKMKLIVISQKQNKQTQWAEFLQKIIVQIKNNTIKETVTDFQNNFSTTDQFSKFFSTAIIMNSFQKYFQYKRMVCICGIQNIHMGGILQDWEKLCTKLVNLQKYDVDGQLKKYIRGLLPVLQQFVETYKGKAHLQFWNNIYQQRKNPTHNPYFPSKHLNGWLLKFFTIYDQIGDAVGAEQFDVPVKYLNVLANISIDFSIVGGCRGISIEDRCVYRPHFSFAVVEKGEAPKIEDEYY